MRYLEYLRDRCKADSSLEWVGSQEVEAALGLTAQLTLDWREAQDVYQVRGWKSCVVLCGGILEAILLDALARDASPRGGQAVPSEANRRDLADLVEAARDRSILGTGLPALGQALRDFPHLIHPGVPTGEKVEVTRDEAEAAMIAVRMCLRQIGAEVQKI